MTELLDVTRRFFKCIGVVPIFLAFWSDGFGSEDWLSLAENAAKSIEIKDERFPRRCLEQGCLLFEASCLTKDRKSPKATYWLKSAREQFLRYKGVGAELVPSILPLFEADRLDQPIADGQLKDLRRILAQERDGEFWLRHILTILGHVSPRLTIQLLLQLPDTPAREQNIGQQLAQIAGINPVATWKCIGSWPEPEAPLSRLRRGIWLGHAMRRSEEQGNYEIPQFAKERTREFARAFFEAAKQPGLGKGPDFQLSMATSVGINWFVVEPNEGRIALTQIRDAYAPVGALETSSEPWSARWSKGISRQTETLRHLAILDLLEDPNREKALQEAILQAFSLRELVQQQPQSEKSGADFEGSYRYTPLVAVRVLVTYNRRIAERAFEQIEPGLLKEDAPIGDDFWLEWITLSRKSRSDKLAKWSESIADPFVRGQTYLRLERFQKEAKVR